MIKLYENIAYNLYYILTIIFSYILYINRYIQKCLFVKKCFDIYIKELRKYSFSLKCLERIKIIATFAVQFRNEEQKKIVLIKNIKSMAKLFINGECIMHDIIESIKSVEAGLQAEGVKYQIEWDWV